MFSIIIPSRNTDNFLHCVAAVEECETGARVIGVDDGLNHERLRADKRTLRFFDPASSSTLIGGTVPFVFARNVNLGIRAAGDDDIVLLNDDALLTTPGGLTLMQRACEQYPEIGIIGATSNCVGNPNQFPRAIGLRPEDRMVCFICVYIPRRTLNLVGLLDERYVGYGMDDDDYCFSVRKAGLKIMVHDGCFVDHKSLRSSYRGSPTTSSDFRPNLELFKQKWGHDNWGRPC